MSKLALFSLAVVLFMAWEAEACGNLFGGGGGGCCAPPPPACGCGRKKREIQGPQNELIAPSIHNEEKNPCPQTEWLPYLEQNMEADPTSNAYAIQGTLYKRFGAKFNVICLPKGDHSFVANGDGYCTHGNDKNWCQATALLA
ncbi:unnamed protein product [Bursaphelenchus xylophilus]|uniref:(pine wood nematode) hypothetical protein n=1 Tax=Bursaphelenchus xylophilus TaxID=6326 RepID=A0A1I7RM44_BURXY|nr:unnamed protein product [Bursaphelenchus xylophilus]CAG9118189.1 unnamed protein product [Bursaphelenchus xylophilus]